MLIACDVDGVLADLHVEWYRRYNQDYDDNLTMEKVTAWGTHEFVKPECGRKIYDYLHHADLYECVPVVAGAVEGVARLRELGHEVLFTTACVYGMTDQKAQWLVRHGFCKEGRALPDDFVAVAKKTAIAADLLIDDGAHNVQAWVQDKGGRAILLEYPHNAQLLKDMPSLFWLRCMRSGDWPGIVRHVENMSRPAHG